MANSDMEGKMQSMMDEPMPHLLVLMRDVVASGSCLNPFWTKEALAEIDRLRSALGLIASFSGKTLIGPRDDEDRRYSAGAHVAFGQAAEIAIDALQLQPV